MQILMCAKGVAFGYGVPILMNYSYRVALGVIKGGLEDSVKR